MGIFDKAKEALNSEKAEEVSDKILDKGEEFAKSKLGDDKADQVTDVRNKIDDRIGNEGNTTPRQEPPAK